MTVFEIPLGDEQLPQEHQGIQCAGTAGASTPTPWTVHYNVDLNQHAIVSEARSDCQHNRVVAIIGMAGAAPEHITAETEENAKRIVACVNALDAFATEEIEKMYADRGSLRASYLTNTEVLCFVLGWQGGTLRQVADVLDVKTKVILEADADQMRDLCRVAQKMRDTDKARNA